MYKTQTPFYAESGGQVGDTGVLVSEFETIEVIDTKKENNLPIHITKKLPEHPEAPMMACVDTDKRAACAANHSATHLLDSAPGSYTHLDVYKRQTLYITFTTRRHQYVY